MTSRAYTAEEMRNMLIEEIRHRARYWANLPDVDEATGSALTIADRCDGVAFSILALLDGCASLPAADIVFRPHEDDKQYHIDEGENWVEPGTVVSDMLHEHYYEK